MFCLLLLEEGGLDNNAWQQAQAKVRRLEHLTALIQF